jgi:ComF family protein
MGFMVGQELANDGFFQGIDLIIPIPLHRRKQRSRGYNQSQEIGKGISRATGIRMETTCVARLRDTTSQTNKSTYERWENVSGIFVLRHPEQLENQHILLLDDVMTTGATITACADALKSVPGIRISVLTLALAGK